MQGQSLVQRKHLLWCRSQGTTPQLTAIVTRAARKRTWAPSVSQPVCGSCSLYTAMSSSMAPSRMSRVGM